MSQICDSVLIFRFEHYHTWTEKIPCHAMLCLSFLSVGLPPTAEDSTEAGGGHGYTDPSAVAQLEQCKFIKENKRRHSRLAKILRAFQHAPRVTSWE